MSYSFSAAWFAGLLLFGSIGVLRGQEPESAGPDGQVSERDARILALFSASQKSLKDGRLRLVYDFETKDQDLPEDWLPALDPRNMRVRWLRGAEGTPTSVEDGICIGDYGEWIHKAVFLPDGLEVTVDLMNYSPHKAGTICGPTFVSEKKKMSLGANMGHQVMCLKGWRAAKPLHPKTEARLTATQRYKSGYKLNGGVLEAYYNGKKRADSTSLPKLTDGFDRGRVGLAWSGSVQSFVYSVTMEGSLDPDWIASRLGEKKSKAKAGAKSKKAGKAEGPGTKPADPATAASRKTAGP